MKIEDFMVRTSSRLVIDDMWMVAEICLDDDRLKTYTVYRKKYGKRKVEVLYKGQNLETALSNMLLEIER